MSDPGIKSDASQPASEAPREKKPYVTPALVEYGSVASLTLGRGSTRATDDGGMTSTSNCQGQCM